MFIPPSLRLPSGDLLASSGDFLRFLEIKRLHHRQPRRCPQQVRAVNLLRLERHRRKRLRTCNIHTTCTIWDVEKAVVEAQLIRYSVSRRVVNLLQLKRHRAEATQKLAWNKQNLRYMATILMDSNELGLRRVVSKFVRVVMMERRCFGELPTVAGPNGIDPMSVYSAGSEINSCSCLVRCLIGLALLFLGKCSSLKFELWIARIGFMLAARH
ncbi:hypothetical protein YC2023_020411 [Brassica napus]